MVFADKSWLEKPRGSQEFYDGVQKFVAHCTPLVNSAGKIRCPCKRCRNILFKPIEWIGDHITDNGWDPLYTVWDKHGEPALPTPPLQATPTPPPLMSDMTALLDDLSYIPPNNEHNEPTQGDIGETSNEPTQATRNEFEELYSSANEALYPGCDHVTRLDFMAKFTYFKVKGKLTDSIFNEMLEWLQYALPESKGYKFPPSYYAIKKTFKTIGLGYESIHACEHDCCLFRGEVNKDLQFCPVCNTSRWKDSDTPGKKVPRKVLRYFPIIPRLQRLYKSRHTAKDMIWHATGKCTEPGKMQHPVDGGAWKKFDMKYPDFAKEPRNVRLGLCADGFNPFGNLSQTYSMWPVILTTYNLPPWLCMKESNFMLTLLIPGPKSPGKDIDVYLRPLIEDLQVLWDKKGVETTDIVSGQNFNMRAMVLWTINDFPARSSLSGWSGQGYKACPTCNEETPSIGVKNKIAYVGHRRFLRKPHKWRSSREFNGDTDHRDPPKEYPRDVILAQHARLLTRVPGKHPKHGGVKIKRNVEVELNWTKRSIFYELEYWSFISLRHNLDIMHIEKNVLEAILNTLLMNDKSKDTAKARQDLQNLGIRRPLWLTKNHKGKIVKPQAAYSFTPENRKKFCQYIKGVKLPDGFGSCFKHKVTDNDTNITGLKSHDCHIMMQRLLPYGLQNYLPDNIAKPIIELSSLFKQLCSATLMEDDMLKASVKVVEILCELERIYPPAFFDIMIHLPIHLALEALEGGPIHPRWMFPFERFMKKLKGYVRNKAKPEGSIAEGYVAEEALTLSSHYFRDVTTKFNRLERNVDPPPPTCQFQAFRSVCNTIGLRSFPPFGAKEFNKARWYVLHNSPEIDTYRAQFQSLFPEKNMLEEFPGWFRTLICERHANNLQDPEVSTTSELFALANGPSRTPMSVNACVVDGVRYVVQSRDERRTTQNSGICAPGPDGEMSYGQLQEILEFKYLSFKVALFRVKWFDTRNNGRVKKLTFRNGMTQIIGSGEWWKMINTFSQHKGVIVVENEPDIIHLDNSSDLPPSTSGNDLDNVTFYIDLHIDGESTEVDAPPDIIDVPGEDDDISDDEDPLPHDLADSDVEDLINDDDGVEKMADVARAHGGDGGGEDPSRPPPTSFGCAGCFINRGKGQERPNLGGDRFEDVAVNTVSLPATTRPVGNYFGEMIRSIPLYQPFLAEGPRGGQGEADGHSWGQLSFYSTYNLEPHMRSERWPRIEGYIQAQFGKSYNTNKATLKREHWIRDPETGAYDLDRIRRGKPDEYTDDEWEKYINFWNDPANAQRAETNRLNRSKSTVVSRHGSRSIPLTRHLMKQASATQEEPSEIDTFYRLHTVNGVFQDPKALRMYDRMRELEATGEYTAAEINEMVRGGKLRGHIPAMGPVLPGYVRSRLSYSAPVDRSNDVDFMMSLMRRDNRFADAFARYDSGGASGSGESRARDSEGEEDGDDTGRKDGGDDTIRSFPSDMSLGNLGPPWHQFLDQKIHGAHFLLRIVAGERFVIELTPSMFPQRHVAGEPYPQRHVAGEGVRMLLGKELITVVHDILDNIILLKCQGLGDQRWTFMTDGTILNPNARLVMDVRNNDVSLQEIILYQLNGNAS
ncbi:hypothetical protein Tco_0953137 [Tanacetum coccineum]|uniref:Uncharacterized protein n=1 Tax=Tanacetum coccineum TaxID=301880 RepID=A0ABQ5DZR1_9ASTR